MINPIMTTDDNLDLYLATYYAFKDFQDELFITASDHNKANGLALWTRTVKHFTKQRIPCY